MTDRVSKQCMECGEPMLVSPQGLNIKYCSTVCIESVQSLDRGVSEYFPTTSIEVWKPPKPRDPEITKKIKQAVQTRREKEKAAIRKILNLYLG